MDEEAITTIRLRASVKDELDKIKVHPRETYEDIIRRLLGMGEEK